jgi:hypothetical protein
MRAVCLAAYSSPRGMELTKRTVFRQVGFRDFNIDPMLVLFYEAIRLGCWEGKPVTKEHDEIIWKAVKDLFHLFETGKIREDKEAVTILQIWRGKADPADDWATLAPVMEPDLRNPMAFAFGMRFVQLNHPEWGRPLIEETVQREKPDSYLYKLAKGELDKLPKK